MPHLFRIMSTLVNQIDCLLPQSDCRRCGYEGCLAYASALAAGEVALNLCLPGQDEVMRDIAGLLNRAEVTVPSVENQLAVIDEYRCIGCTVCIKACPVDAIVGATKLMHTVLADECTGCGLCLPPCPVDCITMLPSNADYLPRRPLLSTQPQPRFAAAEHARLRRLAKVARTARRARKPSPGASSRTDVAALLARAKNRVAERAGERAVIRSAHLQQTLIDRQKTRAAYRNAQRDLRYGNADEQAAALDYLRRINAGED